MKNIMLVYCALSLTNVSITSAVYMLGGKNLLGLMGRSKRQMQSPTLCPSGWIAFGNHCYQVSTTTVSWYTAVQSCQGLNAYLVEVNSEGENTFVTNLTKISGGTVVKSTSSHNCFDLPFSDHTWIGLNDQNVEGYYIWAHSGATPTYANWASRNPDNWQNSEDCVEVDKGKWNDNNCACYKPYVCEMEIRTTTTSTTTTSTTTKTTTTKTTTDTTATTATTAAATAAADTTEDTTAATAAATPKNSFAAETKEDTTATAAAIPKNSISWKVIAVGSGASGFIAAVISGVVICAVRWQRRHNSKGSNNERVSVIACASSKESSADYGQNCYSALAFGNNTDTYCYATYRQGQVPFTEDDGIGEHGFSEKLPFSCAGKSSANN